MPGRERPDNSDEPAVLGDDGRLASLFDLFYNACRLFGIATPGPQPTLRPAPTAQPGKRSSRASRNAPNHLTQRGFDLGGHKVKIGAELARAKVTLRLGGQLIHVITGGALAKTLPSPVPAGDRARLRGARIAGTPLPSPAPGPVSVQRKVPRDGVIMVTRQRLRVGTAHAGKIVTVHVEDTHFRVTCDGTEVSLHPRTEQRPVTRWRAKIHAPKPGTLSSMS